MSFPLTLLDATTDADVKTSCSARSSRAWSVPLPSSLPSVRRLTIVKDVVHAIENVAKNSRDAPLEDVVIFDSGELEIEKAVDGDGNEVPARVEL